MQRRFEHYNLLYEHKVNQYATTTLEPGQQIVSNEKVGQAYLAIGLKKPSDARRRKYKVWADNYAEIFSGGKAEPHVICLLLYQSATAWAKTARRASGITDLSRKLIKNGLLHIARIAAFLWRNADEFNQPTAKLQSQIATLQANPESINTYCEAALKKIELLITANPDFMSDVDAALKASLLDVAITRSLHMPSVAPAPSP